MKRLTAIILLIVAFAFSLSADSGSGSNGGTKNVFLEIWKRQQQQPHRAPLRINVEAVYDSEANAISVLFDGEAQGEAFLYLGEELVGYSNEINSTFQLPSAHGLYTIEIETESWTATGQLEI